MTAIQQAKLRDPLFNRIYPAVLLSLWVLLPEVRRLVDWRVGFNSLSIINVIPLMALLPLAFVIAGKKRRDVSFGFKIIAGLWTAGFGYALLVGWLSSQLVGAAYEFGLFTLPMLIGIWLAMMDAAQAQRVFSRFIDAAIYLAVFVSLYGLYQYVAPPPWDVYWMANSGLTSIGNPVPFEVRVFSVLNSPLTCADFLALTILLSLHRLSVRTLWLSIPLLLCVSTLILTLIRTSWIEVAVGVVLYVCLSPRRGVVLGVSIATLVLTILVAGNLAFLTGNVQVANLVQDRLSTLSDLQDDGSADVRVYGTAAVFHQGFEEPLGQGLGFASGAKLSGGSSASTAATHSTENGYAERFLEMGMFGFALYLASVITAAVISYFMLRASIAARDTSAAPIFATIVTIQVALILADSSADHHLSLMGIFFWLLVGVGAAMSFGLARDTARLPGPQIVRLSKRAGTA